MEIFYNTTKYFEETEGVKSRIAYHYTSISALEKIIKEKTFRLTSLTASNDAKELKYSTNDFINDYKEYVDNISQAEYKQFAEEMLLSYKANGDAFDKITHEKSQLFGLCLTKKRDNLTHWDRYANNCKGVSIAVNLSAIQVYYNRMCPNFTDTLVECQKVKYQKNDIMEAVKKLLEPTSEVLSNTSSEWKKCNLYSFLANIYLCIQPFIKNNAFFDEDEIRLCFNNRIIKKTLNLIELFKTPDTTELFDNLMNNYKRIVRKMKLDEEDTYISDYGIKRFRKLCLSEIWGSGTIPEIIIGPRCTQNINELKAFLKTNGLDKTKISYSKIPIR